MEKIVNALKEKSCIDRLSLDENDINDDAAAVLGDALATLSLKSLSLKGEYEMEHGSISPAGMEAISQGLMQNSSLESLHFGNFPIGVEGGLFLAERPFQTIHHECSRSLFLLVRYTLVALHHL